ERERFVAFDPPAGDGLERGVTLKPTSRHSTHSRPTLNSLRAPSYNGGPTWGLRCRTTPPSFQPWDHLTHSPDSPAARRSTATLRQPWVPAPNVPVNVTGNAPAASPVAMLITAGETRVPCARSD